MIRISKTEAAKLGLTTKKPLRIDRKAKAFPTAGCWHQVEKFGSFTKLVCRLPFPNSDNTHWRHARGRTYISADGKAFRLAVAYVMHGCQSLGAARLRVVVTLYPPDERRRDIGNFDKALFDALTHAGVWDDDSQIDDQRFLRGQVGKPGFVIVEVETI